MTVKRLLDRTAVASNSLARAPSVDVDVDDVDRRVDSLLIRSLKRLKTVGNIVCMPITTMSIFASFVSVNTQSL